MHFLSHICVTENNLLHLILISRTYDVSSICACNDSERNHTRGSTVAASIPEHGTILKSLGFPWNICHRVLDCNLDCNFSGPLLTFERLCSSVLVSPAVHVPRASLQRALRRRTGDKTLPITRAHTAGRSYFSNDLQAVAAEAAVAESIEETTGTNPYDIDVRLQWSHPVDLDLRVSDPMKCEVGFDNVLSCSGGMLFQDIVPSCGDRKGSFEEKITWKLGGASPGIYVIRPQVCSWHSYASDVTKFSKFCGKIAKDSELCVQS
jgi:hypothetical protein